VHPLVSLGLDRLAGLTLVPAVRGNHIRVVSIGRAGAFAAVGLDDVQLIARRLVLALGSVLEMERGPLKSSAKTSFMPLAASGGPSGIPSFHETPPLL